jgi:hypothetical protein
VATRPQGGAEVLWKIAGLIFVAGCLGGLVNCIVKGEFKLPFRDEDAQVFRLGGLGTMVIGGAAAVASWGLYGSLSNFLLIGNNTTPPVLHLAEFSSSLIIGFGGGRWFTAEDDRRVVSKERDALMQTKQSLVETLQKVTGAEK